MPHPKNNETKFKPGRKKTGGRKAGVRNKKTTGLLGAVYEAAEAIGSDGVGRQGIVGYLQLLALNHPPSFCRLIGRVMLLQHEDAKLQAAGAEPGTNKSKYDRLNVFGSTGAKTAADLKC